MKKTQGILGIILGAVIAIGPQTFLHVCGGGASSMNSGMENMSEGMEEAAMPMVMACHNVPAAALITGILVIIASAIVLYFSFKNTGSKTLSLSLDGALAILGVVTIGIPTFIIGVCDAPHMHCHAVTRPALIVLGIFTIIAAAIGFLSERTAK